MIKGHTVETAMDSKVSPRTSGSALRGVRSHIISKPHTEHLDHLCF